MFGPSREAAILSALKTAALEHQQCGNVGDCSPILKGVVKIHARAANLPSEHTVYLLIHPEYEGFSRFLLFPKEIACCTSK